MATNQNRVAARKRTFKQNVACMIKRRRAKREKQRAAIRGGRVGDTSWSLRREFIKKIAAHSEENYELCSAVMKALPFAIRDTLRDFGEARICQLGLFEAEHDPLTGRAVLRLHPTEGIRRFVYYNI